MGINDMDIIEVNEEVMSYNRQIKSNLAVITAKLSQIRRL
jgi:hypothetical protein